MGIEHAGPDDERDPFERLYRTHQAMRHQTWAMVVATRALLEFDDEATVGSLDEDVRRWMIGSCEHVRQVVDYMEHLLRWPDMIGEPGGGPMGPSYPNTYPDEPLDSQE
jgi:hypothetical protein